MLPGWKKPLGPCAVSLRLDTATPTLRTMQSHHLVLFALAGIVLNLTPGPDVLLVVRHAGNIRRLLSGEEGRVGRAKPASQAVEGASAPVDKPGQAG